MAVSKVCLAIACLFAIIVTSEGRAVADIKVAQQWKLGEFGNDGSDPGNFETITYIASNGTVQRSDTYVRGVRTNTEIFDALRHQWYLKDNDDRSYAVHEWPRELPYANSAQQWHVTKTNDFRVILGYRCRKYVMETHLSGRGVTVRDTVWVAEGLPPFHTSVYSQIDTFSKLGGMVIESMGSSSDASIKESSTTTESISRVNMPTSFYRPDPIVTR